MSNNPEKLYHVAQKDSRRIIGLMSGTSLDGLDIAVCQISGHGSNVSCQLEAFRTVAYNNAFREKIQSVFSKKIVALESLTLLHKWIAWQHAGFVCQSLAEWGISPGTVDLIASHGQTVYHAPLHLHQLKEYGHATLQIGDGDHLATATGIITVSDFRQKQIAGGGEGAPLAAYGDYLLYGNNNIDTVLLNIGGIANFTYIPAGASFSTIVCSDTGPGNTLMDQWVQQHHTGLMYDTDASLAKQGRIDEKLLAHLLQHPYFKMHIPKTTGPEMFSLSYLEKCIEQNNPTGILSEDVMATLNRLTGESIVQAINAATKNSKQLRILVSGGGCHNPLLMSYLKNALPNAMVQNLSETGINPDAKEAILFALLANETVAGDLSAFGKGAIGFPAISMGKISFPG